MARKRKPAIGEKVALIGQHRYVGHSAEVIEGPDMAGRVKVKLDNGHETWAAPRQWAPYERLFEPGDVREG